ncbi:MAG TPA: cytochrome c [Rhodanobacteraceae bacterium]|jgi:cytochrome c553|nr:cytochrome c [Rhodanobacteraceae bacterium]
MQNARAMALILALVMPLGALAATEAPPRPPQLGLCSACHGEDGHARIPGAPNLAGQSSAYLLQALRAYRSGQRDVPVMRAAAGPLTEKDMQALANWYAAQSPCKPPQAASP